MIGQQHIQAAKTGLCMLASIKKWANTHYDILANSGGTSKIYDNLCYFTSYFNSINTSPATKCPHKFQPK